MSNTNDKKREDELYDIEVKRLKDNRTRLSQYVIAIEQKAKEKQKRKMH